GAGLGPTFKQRGITGEHEVRRDVDQAGAGARACPRNVFGGGLIDRIRPRFVTFGAVDIGVRGAIDNDVATFHDRLGGGRVGDVPLRGRQCQYLATLVSGLGRQATAQLPAGSGDD